MEPKQMVMTQAEPAPPPEPTVPEPSNGNRAAELDELCRNLSDAHVRAELARLGVNVSLNAPGRQSNGAGVTESGELSQTLSEVKALAERLGGPEKLRDMVNMLLSLKN